MRNTGFNVEKLHNLSSPAFQQAARKAKHNWLLLPKPQDVGWAESPQPGCRPALLQMKWWNKRAIQMHFVRWLISSMLCSMRKGALIQVFPKRGLRIFKVYWLKVYQQGFSACPWLITLLLESFSNCISFFCCYCGFFGFCVYFS